MEFGGLVVKSNGVKDSRVMRIESGSQDHTYRRLREDVSMAFGFDAEYHEKRCHTFRSAVYCRLDPWDCIRWTL